MLRKPDDQCHRMLVILLYSCEAAMAVFMHHGSGRNESGMPFIEQFQVGSAFVLSSHAHVLVGRPQEGQTAQIHHLLHVGFL